MKKLLLLCTIFSLGLAAQTVLVCGLSRGCTFAGLGQGVSYDPVTNRIVAAVPAAPPFPKLQVDMFSVNCAKGLACPAGVPQSIFSTTKPVSSLVVALRAISQYEGADFAKVVNADGTWTITFFTPVDCGTVGLIYQTP